MASIYLSSLLSVALFGQPPVGGDLIAFGFDGFDPGINRSISASNTKEKLVQRFGKPNELKMKKEPHKRDPTVLHVEIYTWQWEGLEIITARPILYEGYDKPHQWIKEITLISPNYKLKFGLSIGARREAFIEQLGQPFREAPQSIRYRAEYYASEGGASFVSRLRVSVEFDGEGWAKKIIWRYF